MYAVKPFVSRNVKSETWHNPFIFMCVRDLWKEMEGLTFIIHLNLLHTQKV